MAQDFNPRIGLDKSPSRYLMAPLATSSNYFGIPEFEPQSTPSVQTDYHTTTTRVLPPKSGQIMDLTDTPPESKYSVIHGSRLPRHQK